ncbi:centromere-associated protein E isoform X2 [Alosa sapidissima]|uniref:centromere-associated protein E isoform X2 n=1 Tax=Alosa sapidissima TaxID=34773 RepID=UPI001C0854C2|nr:centromere-associated protein E isoform X2 [Alosa sapidissima]
MTEESAVKVCVRVRPLIQREEAAAENAEPVQLYWRADKQTIHQVDDGNPTKSFSFDRVFSAEESTNQLYQDIAKSLVVSTVEGYNGTIFAYGQTSSGKTFTMMGNSRTPGVIPLAMEDVFQTIKNCPKKEFLLRVSYMEIYNETVTDLLCDSWKRKPLEIREGNYKNVYVADLTEELVTSPDQALAWIRKGEKNRHYGKTKMNERSSRSHTIFRMIIESRERSDPASGEISDGAIIVSHLNLVDLAGAERASQTGAEGTRFKEGCNINRSLFTLGQVIKKLSDENQKGFTNYRDSKLTRILQNSLGGNAKTVIVCTITPAVQDETLSTLQFASAAKRMKNDPHVTEVSDDGALLRRYRNEINELKQRLQEVSSVTKTTVTEKQTLCQLLQEKEQLQREQEDRIRNLTKLLVTSNVVLVKKLPKRRMTWGGKLLQAAHPSDALAETDAGFMEPFVKQRRIDLSAIVENEDMEEFEGRWEIPLERTFDMDLNQSSVTTRNSSESDYCSPRVSEMKGRLANLEEQLEKEVQLRQEMQQQLEKEAQEKRELHLQLENEAQEKQEVNLQLEKETQGKQELHLQLEKEAQEKQELHLQLEKETQGKQELHLQLEKEAQEKQELHLQLEKEAQEKQELHLQLEKEAQEKQELHLQLEKETQGKQELHLQLEKESQDQQELHLQLEKEMQGKQELHLQHDMEKELQHQLEVEALQKQEALERAAEMEKKVMELEQQLEATPHNTSNYSSEQFKRDLGESIQLCESLCFEKERLEAERDALQKELQVCGEEVERLRRDSEALQEELVQKREMDEFQCLEEESKREYEKELLAQITTLKKAAEDSNIQAQKLKVELDTLSDLQGDKDLVQEVKRLRRSLEDAECLSLDTKKEWAFLRSENISLKERDDVLTAEHQRMQSELHSVQVQLEAEKNRFKKMQIDLQKELMGAFDENTKLTTLLDGKVPKNLLDGVILERTVAELQKELEQHKQNEEELQSQLKEALEKAQEQQQQELLKAQEQQQQFEEKLQQNQEMSRVELQGAHEQLEKLQQELQRAQEQGDLVQQELHKAQEQLQQDKERHQQDLQSSQEQHQELLKAHEHLQEEHQKTTELLRQDLKNTREVQDGLQLELQNALKKHDSLQQELHNAQEHQQHWEAEFQRAQQQQEELQQELQKAQEQLRDHPISQEPGVEIFEELEVLRSELGAITAQRAELQEILEGVREEKNQLKRDLEESVDMCVQTQSELQQLQSRPSCSSGATDELLQQQKQELEELRQEKQQLQADLQENVDMMIENQTELREALDEVRELKGQLVAARLASAQVPDATENSLEATAELDRLRSEVTSLTAELDHLKSASQSEGGQKAQELQEALQQELHKVQETQRQKEEELQRLRDQLQEELQKTQESPPPELLQAQEQQRHLEEKLQRAEEVLQQELQRGQDEQERLQQKLQKAEEKQETLQHQLCEIQEQQKQKEEELRIGKEQKEQLEREHQEIQEMLQQQLCNTQDQRPHQEDQAPLQQELHQAQLEQQQQELLKAQEQHQQELLKAQQCLEEELNTALEQQLSLEKDLQKAQERLEQLQQELQETRQQHSQDSLKAQERQQYFEEELRKNEQLLHREYERAQEQQAQLQEELLKAQEQLQHHCTPQDSEEASGELERLRSDLSALTAQRAELQEILEGLKEEKNQLKRDLEENMDMAQQELEELRQEKRQMQTDLENNMAKASELETQLRCVTEERQRLLGDNEVAQTLQKEVDQLRSEVSSLSADREQLQEKLRDDEKRHSEELQELSVQREQLVQQLSAATVESAEELERLRSESAEELEKLRSEVSTLTTQRAELQEMLEAVREERSQLKRDLEENGGMAQQQLNELEEIRLERRQLQTDLQNNMERASELETQLRCVTEERQRLLGDNEVAQTLQKEVAQLRSEVSSLSADREQLQEKLREDEKRHSEELQELSVQRQQLLQQLSAATVESAEELERLRSESAEELERLRSDVGMLTTQRAELQEMLEAVREERSQLKRDLEENGGMAQQQQNELEEIRLEKRQLQTDLQNNMERANELQAQLRCVTEERQRLLGDNEVAQTLQKEVAQLRSEVSSLSADREQLQEKLRKDEKRHSEELQELSVQREQLSAATVESAEELERLRSESAEELERLRSEVSVLTTQRAELQEMLEAVREERSQLKRDLEENVDMVQHMKAQRTSYPEHSELVVQENESQQRLQAWSLRIQRLADQLSQKLRKRWTTELLASAELTERRLTKQLLSQTPHLAPLTTSLKKSTLQLQDLLWTRLATLQKLAVTYRGHYEALWEQEASAVDQSGLIAQAQKSTSGHPCPPQDVLLCLLLERRELHLQEMAASAQRLEEGVAELEKVMSVELQHRVQANQGLEELSSRTPAEPSALGRHLQQETSRRHSVASCEQAICHALVSEQQRLANSKMTHEQRRQTVVPLSLLQPPISELQQDKQQLCSRLQQALTHTQTLEKKLQHLQGAHDLSSQQCSEQLLQLKELQDKLAHSQTLAQRKMTPSAVEMQKMKDRLVNMEMENTNLNTGHQQELERLTSVLKYKEELIRKLKEDLRMKQQDDEHSYMEDNHSKHCDHQEEIQQLQQKIAQLESTLSSQQEEVDRWKRRAYKLKESRREGGLHTPIKHGRPPTPTKHTPTKHTLPLTPTKHTLTHTQARPSPSKRPALGEAPLLNSPQRPLLDSPKSLFFDMPPGTHAPPIARTKGFFDNCALGPATDSEEEEADPLVAEGSTGGGSAANKKDEWWPQSPRQGQQCETQ